ncbi:MAG: hypothetical protein ACRELG_25625, partial [Gemmataceae bacterium]
MRSDVPPLEGAGVRLVATRARQSGAARVLGRMVTILGSHGSLTAAVFYVALSLWYYNGATAHMGSVCACDMNRDPTQWMWEFAWLPYAIGHGLNPLVPHVLWAPDGVNLAGATIAPLTALVGVPVTALFGPVAGYNAVSMGLLPLDAWCAYLLCKQITHDTWPSLLGGYMFGFSAYTLGQALQNLQLVAVFPLPLAALVVLRHLDGLSSRRRLFAEMTAVVFAQLMLSGEVSLTATAVGLLALGLTWLFGGPECRSRVMHVGALIAGAYVVAGGISSYYLYEEVRASTYVNNLAYVFPNDLLSFFFPTQQFLLGGHMFKPLSATYVTGVSNEQGAYLGLPAIAIVCAYVAQNWRRVCGKVIGITCLVVFVLSLGTTLTIGGNGTIGMPYAELAKLPLASRALPDRLSVYVALCSAVACAAWVARGTRGRRRSRWALAALAVAFLVPNVGLPGRTAAADEPTFFTSGAYRDYLHPGETVLPIPFAWALGGQSMLWQASAHMRFNMLGGYWGVHVAPSYTIDPAISSAPPLPIVNELLGFAPPDKRSPHELNSLLVSHEVTAV